MQLTKGRYFELVLVRYITEVIFKYLPSMRLSPFATDAHVSSGNEDESTEVWPFDQPQAGTLESAVSCFHCRPF